MHRYTIALALVLTACVSYKPEAPPAILAGARAIPMADPVAAASVIIMGEGGHYLGDGFCNGVLIRARVVLTAAHCLRSISRPYYVTTMAYWQQNLAPNPDDDGYHPYARAGVRIERFLFHPAFERDFSDKRHSDDLALALLEGDLPPPAAPARLVDAGLQVHPVNPGKAHAKTHAEFWQLFKGSQLLLGVYAPYGAYRGFDTIYTKLPLAFLALNSPLHMLSVLPETPHLIIRGNSGSGVYTTASSAKGPPRLVGILVATADSDTFEVADAMDLRSYLEWTRAGMARLDLDHQQAGSRAGL